METIQLELITGKNTIVLVKDILQVVEQDGTDARSVVLKGGSVFYVKNSLKEVGDEMERYHNSTK